MTNEEATTSTPFVPSTSTLCRDIASLYLKQKFSDVSFIIGDHKLYAHKILLATRSQYFEALLYGGLEESRQSVISINDVPLEVFKMLLRYIYTDHICVTPTNTDLVFQLFAVANKYCMKDLQNLITSKLKPMINMQNVCHILNMANLYYDPKLRDACHAILEENPLEFLNDGLRNLTRDSLIGLLGRDTFYAPEIEIFRAIAKWLIYNEDVDNSVFECVRLRWLSVDEILQEVWPTNVFTEKELMNAMSEMRGFSAQLTNPRALLVPNENVASLDRGAQLLPLSNDAANFSILKYDKNNAFNFLSQNISANDFVVIKLPSPTVVNHIRMILYNTGEEHYSYYVETTLDDKNWERIVDHSKFPCRSVQNLYFGNTVTRYLKVVGTHSSWNNIFRLSCFEAYYKTDIPPMINNFIRPGSNVATVEAGASVLKGRDPTHLLNGDTKNYGPHTGYTYHMIEPSGMIIVQLAQPFVLSSMKLLLWDLDERLYKYYIETSADNVIWEVVADYRNENRRSWQNIRFEERLVVFVKIVGTANTANGGFHCVHFECPDSDLMKME